MTTKTTTVSQAKPKAAAKAQPTKQEQAAAAVARMRQAALEIVQPSPVAEIVQIPLNFIRCAAQVRTEFNDETIQELAGDIADHGVIQPILVRRLNDGYQVIAGERRVRAAKLAELDMIPAIVTELDNDRATAVQIAENIQREDLSTADTAKAVRKLYELNDHSVTDTAAKLHKSKSWVSKHLAASCPDLRYMAKELLEGGYVEDLEIVLAVDKLQLYDYCKCQDICRKIKDGKAGRKTVLDALAKAKAIYENVQEARKVAADPATAAEQKRQREEQQKQWEAQQKAEAEKRDRDPMRICNLICIDAEYEPGDRTPLTEEQITIVSAHLKQQYDDGKQASYADALREMIARKDNENYTPLEVGAYVMGMQGAKFDAKELIALTVKTIEELMAC